MKNLIKITIIFFLFLTVVATSNAQDEKKCPKRHGCPMADSTNIHDFSSAMDNFDMNEFPFRKNKKKYNGHWAGIELGISGYATPEFNMNFNPSYPYMNMNTARSLTVNLNPFDLNVNLYKNHIGFTTGLGLQISNYYFTNNFVMLQDSSALVAYKVQDLQGNQVTMRVNKMVISYLNVPLFFEYQTNRYRRLNSFHTVSYTHLTLPTKRIV